MKHTDFSDVDTHGPTHLRSVERIMDRMKVMHGIKEKTYRGSWANRGYVGVFYTMVRPWDRIENMFTTTSPDKLEESINARWFFDALIDVALYCLKMAATIAQRNPELWKEWQRENIGHVDDNEKLDETHEKELDLGSAVVS